MKTPSFLATCAFAASSLLLPELRAELSLHPLFSDHGVLQQAQPVPVWGWADPGVEVTVSFGEQEKTTTVDSDGRWLALLDPLTIQEEGTTLLVESGDESIEITDLLVGEVWVCSGQSNMGMSVNRSLEGDFETATREAEAGKLKPLRLFKVPIAGEDERQDTVNARWQTCSPQSVAGFSATGFYFGRALQQARGVPVGLIQSANGGTNAYSWINGDTLENDPVAEATRTVWKATVAKHPAAQEHYTKALATWKEKVRAAKEEGKPAPSGRAPREPLGPNHVKRPAGHYRAMIAPLQPYAIKGAIWYQGEANSRPPFAPQYCELMLALVEDWRADWAAAAPGLERRDFPFFLVQLPNFAGGHEQGWPVIREQMLQFGQEGTHTGTVVTIDVGEANDIHPRDKRPVGERLARLARSQTYGEDLVSGGPVFESLTVEEDRAILRFDQVGDGLKSLDRKPLRHFTIAGEEGIFVAANAEIVDDTVVVHSPDVPHPRAVRYAWTNNPEKINFANQADLPASPFRTDSWKIELE